MFSKKSLLVVFTVFVFSECGFVENLHKCKIDDGGCQKDLMQSVLRDIAKTGVPELDIPQLDPAQLKNVSISVLDVLDITLIEGTFKGVKDCIIGKFVTNIDKGRTTIELTCDITVKGRYKVFSSSPLIKNLFGGENIQGEGNGKVKIEKLFFRIDFQIFVKKQNGELFINCKPDQNKYSYDIKGKMAFFADNLYIGKQESSKLVTGMLNQNWKFLMSSFGKPFMDKGMEFIHGFLAKFFHTVPARHYIIDDLSSYVTSE